MYVYGYEDANGIIMHYHEEEEITGFITEAIQNRLVTVDCPRWCEHYALQEVTLPSIISCLIAIRNGNLPTRVECYS
jgi:hypothetical protein